MGWLAALLSMAGCVSTTAGVMPDQIPAVAEASHNGKRIVGKTEGPGGASVSIDGYLESVVVNPNAPSPKERTFTTPLTASWGPTGLTVVDEDHRGTFLDRDIVLVEVTTTEKYRNRRVLGWGLTAPAAACLVGAGATLAEVEGGHGSANGGGLGDAFVLYGVTIPLAVAGVTLLAVGVPMLVSGYSEPEGATELKKTGAPATQAGYDPRAPLRVTW